MKQLIVGLVLVFSFAQFNHLGAVASVDQDGGLILSRNDLHVNRYSAEKLSFELRTPASINVCDLTSGINPTRGETAESIRAKIDEQRQKLYPEEEIILIVTIPKTADEFAGGTVTLVKALYWWNNKNSTNSYWYAKYSSTVATMFISDVRYGKYKVYDMVGTGSWVYRYLVSVGGSASRYSYSPLQTRGFKGVAVSTSCADVVMYFFK